MATIAEMLVKLGMDASGFKSGVQTATAETKKLQDSFKKIEQAGKQISSVGKAITLGVTTPVLAAAGALVTFGNSAQTSIQIERSFNSVAQSAGHMGDEMLRALQKSSRGLISNTDLMKNFNLAASLVSKKFATELPEAFGYLGKVSASTGESMDYLLNSLVKGVGRLSPVILDNLGIQVSLNEAYETYAKKIGKAVDELSKAEQQSAVMELTMKKLADATAGMSDEFGTTGERIKTAMTNAKDAIGKNLAPALEAAGEKLIPVIERFAELFDAGGALHPIIDKVVEAIGKLADGAGKAVDWLSQLDSETVETAASFVIFLAAAGPVLTILGKLTTTGAQVVGTLTNIGTAFGLAGSAATLAGGAFAAALVLGAVGIYALHKEMERGDAIREEYLDTVSKLTEAVRNETITEEQYNIIMADLHRGFITNKEAIEQLPKVYNATTDAVEDNIEALLNASQTYEEFQDGIKALGVELPLMTEEIWNEAKAMQGVSESAEAVTESVIELTEAQLKLNSQLSFVHNNLDTYSQAFERLIPLKAEFNAIPLGEKDGERAQEILGLIGEIEGAFDNMVAKANAASLFEAIMSDGVATQKEMQTYIDYLIRAELATEEQTERMMQDWQAMNDFQQSLRWDAEGNAYLYMHDEATATLDEIIAKVRDRTMTVTVNVQQMGRMSGVIEEFHKALGGPVQAGVAYVVGERGEELFVPDVDGHIVPHHDIDKYTRTDSTENVMTHFGKFDEAGTEYVQNNYTLNMPTTADSSNVQMAFRMMEALG